MSVAFSVATPDDDAALRRLLANSAMPGRIRIRLEREPDYFAGCAAMGPFTQVLVAREGSRVVGLACRAVRPMYINGVREDVGYLGQLRVDPQYRGRSLVARGFALLRELHGDGRARGYVTTIVTGNVEAEGVLVRSRRPSMPRYRFLDAMYTLALRVQKRRAGSPAGPTVDDGPAGEPALRFLSREGPRRQFFSVWDGPAGLDLVTVRRGGELAGVAALWDQSAYKQTVIDGYDRLLTAARPLYNLFTRGPRLPPPGSALRTAYGSYFCAANDDAEVARELIAKLLQKAAEKRFDHLLLGFSARDPLLAAARAFRPIEYRSDIYTVVWNDGDDFHDRLDSRPARLELATL
jgi:predicted N-acetyltransferase YhbS